jgi:large subunit ribosomal protein L22
MKAFLKNYRQSPRKVSLVAGLVRGKSVSVARAALAFAPQKSAEDVLKLLNSAVSNASQQGYSAEDLSVKSITVNKGLAMRRFMPRSRGRATKIMKTASHIAIELRSVSNASPKAKEVKKPVKAARVAKVAKTTKVARKPAKAAKK